MAEKDFRQSYEFYDRFQSAMSALTQSLQKTDRILLTDMKIKVRASLSWENGINAPGFTIGEKIYINYDKFQNIGSASTLVAFVGLNYHELSHYLYTPRFPSALRTAILTSEVNFQHWNALEDQRIESLFWAEYPSAAKYFTQMVIDFMVDNEKAWPLGHSLVYGRKFVPLEIRQGFEDRWGGTVAERMELEQLIDEFKQFPFHKYYNSAVLGTDAVVAVERIRKVVIRYGEIVDRVASRLKVKFDPQHCKDNKSGGKGIQRDDEDIRPEAREQGESAVEKMKKQEKDQEKKEEEGEDGSGFWDDVEEGDDEEDSEDAESASESESAEGAESNKKGDSKREDSEEEDSGDFGEDGNGGGGDDRESDEEGGSPERGSGASDSEDDSDDDDVSNSAGMSSQSTESASGDEAEEDFDLEDLLEEAAEAIERSTEVKDTVKQLQNTLNDPGALEIGDNYIPGGFHQVTPAMRKAVEETTREFNRLYAELEPGWKYESDNGRLNAERWERDHDFDSAFDEWDEGREQASGLEIVCAIDTSGSMRGDKMIAAAQNLWILKRAADEVGAIFSAVTFASVTETWHQRKDVAERNQYFLCTKYGGATIIDPALHIMRRILNESDQPNKLGVVITDGIWSTSYGTPVVEGETAKEILESTIATKMLIGIGTSITTVAPYFDIAQSVGSASDVAPLVAKVIEEIIRKV